MGGHVRRVYSSTNHPSTKFQPSRTRHNARTLEATPPRGGAIRVPVAAFDSPLKPRVFVTLALLQRHANYVLRVHGSHTFHVGRTSLAALCGFGEATAQRHLARLEAVGAVTRLTRGGWVWKGHKQPTEGARGLARTSFVSDEGAALLRTGVLTTEAAAKLAEKFGPDRRRKGSGGRRWPSTNGHQIDTPNHQGKALGGDVKSLKGSSAVPTAARLNGFSKAGLPGPQVNPALEDGGVESTRGIANKASSALQAAVSALAGPGATPAQQRAAEAVLGVMPLFGGERPYRPVAPVIPRAKVAPWELPGWRARGGPQ